MTQTRRRTERPAPAGGRRRDGAVTYGVEGAGDALHRVVHQALSTWAGWTGLRFRPVPHSAGPDVLVRWAPDDDLPGGACGPAMPGGARRGPDGRWTVMLPPPDDRWLDPVTLAVHHVGHALGLTHSPVAGSVMEPFYAGLRRVLHADDIACAMALHGDHAIAEAVWVHGTAVAVERPQDAESVRRFGFFTRVVGRPGTFNGFHFAIPTPVVRDGERRVLGPAMLRFQTGSPEAVVQAVHVYDGELRVAAHEGLDLWGAQPFRRFGIAHRPEACWGVGVSVVASFGRGSEEERAIDLIGAGCDLEPAAADRRER